jgi:N-acetylglucosamine kinase-like BadF-type ATPase
MVSADENKIKIGARQPQKLFLGVDGGGTKTFVVIINEKREIVAEGLSGASNPVRVGIETAVANISEAVSIACDKINQISANITAATLGLAGVRREDLRLRIHERLSQTLKIKSIEVLTDAEIALYGAVKDEAGLVVIAGTGSICLGKNANGEKFSAGGWGPLAGDEGGGAGIARDALRAIAKASDNRSRQTILTEKAMEYFRAGKPDDLVLAIYAPQIDNLKIAGFAKFVVEAAKEGDKVAIGIINKAGRELGIAANAVIRKLKLENEKFPIGKVGSVFKAKKLITKPFLETVQKTAPKAFLIKPLLPPAVAAAHLAMSLSQKKKSFREVKTLYR